MPSHGPISWGLKLPNCGGVLCPPEWARPDTILAIAAKVEAHGFDTVWFHDHLVTPDELRHLKPRFYEPLLTMGAVAASHPNLRVGVATIVLPLRDPVLLAKQIGTLASFHPGRVLIGLGAGRYASEFEALGLDSFSRRGPISAEHLEIMMRLLTEDAVSFVGPTRALSDVSMNPQPEPRPLLLYAGNVPVAAKRAARLADGWIGASMPVQELEETVEQISTLRTELGRSEPFLIAYSVTIVRDDGAGSGATDANENLHLHATTVSGDANRVAELLAQYVEAGVELFQVSLRASTLEELDDNLAWFADEVLPRMHLAPAPDRP
jgi:alkanesulfonate monooxygenase SsuD/methylene tetrahydromethanopterin reductase-like flavin-dependent oxidoreductase (luciferase family)